MTSQEDFQTDAPCRAIATAHWYTFGGDFTENTTFDLDGNYRYEAQVSLGFQFLSHFTREL